MNFALDEKCLVEFEYLLNINYVDDEDGLLYRVNTR